MVRLLLFFLGAIGIMLVMASGLNSASTPAAEPSRAAMVVAKLKRPASGDVTEVQRDASGQFHLTAKVNGEDTVFLVDTGADAVTLTIADAERLGIDVDRNSFKPIAKTASGVGYGTRVRLDQIEVAGQEFEDVEALVIDGLDVNLLGQTVLRRMEKVELRGDTLLISRAS